MEKNLDVTKPRYSKQILPVSGPFVFPRFHCITLRVKAISEFQKISLSSEAKCEAIVMKMIFNYDANKSRFHNKGFALSLVLKGRFLELGNGLLSSIDFRDFSRKNHAQVTEEGRCCLHNVIAISSRRIFVYPFCLNDICSSLSDDAFSFSYL